MKKGIRNQSEIKKASIHKTLGHATNGVNEKMNQKETKR